MFTFTELPLDELRYIILRNVFVLTNAITLAVVTLLFIFGNQQAGLFLGFILLLNITIGLVQDTRAWLALQKLQLLTAPHVIRMNEGGSEVSVLTEEIKKGDCLKLEIGDQIPCDGILLSTHGLEINEGLLTGESNSIPKSSQDQLFSGGVITSGSGVMRVEKIYQESRIARMTEGIKKHSVNISPIQDSVNKVITVAGYILLFALAFVLLRGYIIHETPLRIVITAGALASMLVPQGLMFTISLFYAYGAAHFFRRHVLLQEMNATEKLGRIQNLCMDKTGTLTEDVLAVETMHLPPGISKEEAQDLTAAYIQGTKDSSQTMNAIKKSFNHEYRGAVRGVLTFSSWRQYGAVSVSDALGDMVVFTGPPEIFLPHLSTTAQKEWLQEIMQKNSREGKRIICILRSDTSILPRDLANTELRVAAVFIFYNNLREGIRDTINFFQNRGVRIRIISGDNVETVRAVAASAGINHTNHSITGTEMEVWTPGDFEKNVALYTIFARIIPEVKEKIIEAFKKDGFTAMVGDGANDALAIKKADLGIAMFDGAPATRQLASVVLTNNSFSALPGGVELADSIIRNLEIFGSIFLNQTFIGFFLFVAVSIFGYGYPLTPLNITLINYFIVGIPGLLITFWAIHPIRNVKPTSTQPFLARILPFALSSALIQTLGVAAVFFYHVTNSSFAEVGTLISLSFMFCGFMFFILAPTVFSGTTTNVQKIQLFVLGLCEILLLILVFHIPFFLTFFNIVPLPLTTILSIVPIMIISWALQYLLARLFFLRNRVKSPFLLQIS